MTRRLVSLCFDQRASRNSWNERDLRTHQLAELCAVRRLAQCVQIFYIFLMTFSANSF
jgi:hypothetical protein